MWEDTQFADGEEKAVAVIAAVRKASPSTTRDAVNNAPFLAPSRVGPLAFSLNGHAFHASCEARVRGALAPGTPLDGDTDSEVLFALARERIEAGATPPDALAAVHHVIDPGAEVYVNLLLVTPEQIVATTWQHTLYVQTGTGGATVASEALDPDGGWARVPDASLLVADADHVRITPLEGTTR
jgi:glutamine amidotransferase